MEQAIVYLILFFAALGVSIIIISSVKDNIMYYFRIHPLAKLNKRQLKQFKMITKLRDNDKESSKKDFKSLWDKYYA